MRARPVVVTTLAGVALMVSAAPARAHEEISPRTFPVGQSAFLTLIVANESSGDVGRIALRSPAGLALGAATRSPPGWTAAVNGSTVTWTGGALKPGTFETYGFETEGADQPGTFTYSVTSTNAAGRDDTHEVAVTATAPDAGGPATATSSPATGTAAPAAPVTTGAAAGNGGGSGGDSDGSGLAAGALAVSIVALLVAGAALLRAGGRARPASSPGPSDGAPGAGPAEDW
jgi:uncharacterized protein YcnI